MRRKARIAGVVWCVAALFVAAAGASAQGQHAAQAGATTPERKLTVERAFMVANGSMVQVRFTVPPAKTTQWIPVDQKDTYLVDEATGEKFFVMNLVRIGPAAQVRVPKGGGSSYMIIDNAHEHLKPGARVTVVIGDLKQEHVTVADQ